MLVPALILVLVGAAAVFLVLRARHARTGAVSRDPTAVGPRRTRGSRDLTPEFHEPAREATPEPASTGPPRRQPMTWDDIDPAIRARVETKIAQLSTLPTMMTQLLQLLQDSDSDPREIAKAASTDPAVVTEVLRTVNSSFYGLRTKLTDVSRAILMLGYNKVKLIVLDLGVQASLENNEDYRKRLGAIWRHSFLVSEAVAHLNKTHGGENDAPTAALLHDLGKLLLLDLEHRPDLEVDAVFFSGAATAEERIFLEEDYFGVNHCLIGEKISEKLQLSDTVRSVQLLHHHSMDDPRILALDAPRIRCIAAVKLGNALANEYARLATGHGQQDGSTVFFPDVEPYRRHLPWLESWAQLTEGCERPLREASAFLATFLPEETETAVAPQVEETPTEQADPMSIAGRYRLLDKIGEGSVGTVHLCEDALLGQRFAIKIMRPGTEQSSQAIEVFVNEVRIALNLAHPNIVRVFHFDRRDGVTFILQEFLEGRSLSEVLAACRPRGMDESRVLGIATQLADALAYAHDRGVIHRDVNPNNVIVDAADGVKLLDFGVAACKTLHGAGEADAWGYVAGTAAYMSPEHWLGIDRVDPRSDIFSLGVLLYRLLSGNLPFAAGSHDELQSALRAGGIPPLPGVSEPMSRLVLRCLEASPDDRWKDCHDLADRLRMLSTEPRVAVAGTGG